MATRTRPDGDPPKSFQSTVASTSTFAASEWVHLEDDAQPAEGNSHHRELTRIKNAAIEILECLECKIN
jgi:hypothetical protein